MFNINLSNVPTKKRIIIRKNHFCYEKKNISNLSVIDTKKSEKHLKWLETLFYKFNLTTLEEWMFISKRKLQNNGGKRILSNYSDKPSLLLSTLYPNFPFDFNLIPQPKTLFSTLTSQQLFLENIFHKLNFKTLDNFLSLSKVEFIKEGGQSLLYHYYFNDYSSLLSTLFPNYPFDFSQLKKAKRKSSFETIEKQREFMDSLFSTLQFTSLDHFLTLTRNSLIHHGGKNLILFFYRNNLLFLLSSLYPNYPWPSSSSLSYSSGNINNNNDYYNQKPIEIHSRRLSRYREKFIQILQRLSILHFSSSSINLSGKELMEGIMKLRKQQLIRAGGFYILSYFNNDLSLLLRSLFPHLFQEDFNNGKEKICAKKEKMSFDNFNDNFFRDLKYRSNKLQSKTKEFAYEKIKYLQLKYQIKEKKDWYRLQRKDSSHFDLFHSLQLIYPDQDWSSSLFFSRSKKTKQRSLFLHLFSLFPSFLFLENYLFPFPSLNDKEKKHMEIDVFIPALNVGIEYHGEHHYHDIPSKSSHVDLYQSRDQLKLLLSSVNSIQLFTVPYWWNLSISSLYSSFVKSISFKSKN